MLALQWQRAGGRESRHIPTGLRSVFGPGLLVRSLMWQIRCIWCRVGFADGLMQHAYVEQKRSGGCQSRLRLVTGCSPAHPAFITKAANQDAHSQCFRCQLMDQSWLPINCVSAKKRKKKGSTFDKLKHIWPQKELGGHFSMRHSCIFAGLNISDQLIVHLHGVTPGLVPRLFQKHIKSARGVFT